MGNDTQHDGPGDGRNQCLILRQFRGSDNHDEDDTRQASWPEPANEQLRVQPLLHSNQAEHHWQHAHDGQAEHRINKDLPGEVGSISKISAIFT